MAPCLFSLLLSWVRRNPALIRLTGKHPFNCEAPFPNLVDSGPLTPTDHFFVRNHGYVPRLDWDSWQVGATGQKPVAGIVVSSWDSSQ